MRKWILRLVSYILVAALASAVTLMWPVEKETSKLERLEALIHEKFIGEADSTAMQDAAANAMVMALPDQWSYYISAEEFAAHRENKQNSYVGIGITIQVREDNTGFDIVQVEPGSPAQEAGIRFGDVLVEAEGQSVAQLGLDGTRNIVRGQEGTKVSVGILRGEEKLTLEVERRRLTVTVASGEMLPDNIGLVTIANFNDRCADETISVIEQLVQQGAKALIFDVRNNPGGYKEELVELLDYLLPEGPLFCSVSYDGEESWDRSGESCLEMPMAVLINERSYSAAEFFAAALIDYEWAVSVGQPTVGKGYYQNTFLLGDGSGVSLSVGKYYTPNRVNLAETGGLVPQVPVEVDMETDAAIYARQLTPEEDAQIQAAVAALTK
jgi:carboxyl-terminal processing protease